MLFLESIRLGFESARNHKNAILIEILGSLFTLVFLVLIWSVLLKDGSLKGYDLKSIVVYYLFINFLAILYASAGGFIPPVLSSLIMKGKIKDYLVRPFNFLYYFIFFNFGKSIVNFSLIFLLFVLFFLFFKGSFLNLVILIFIILISTIFFILIRSTVGLLAFWLEDVSILAMLVYFLIMVFSGRIIPLDFYPNWLLKIIDWLPFKYMYYLPSAYFASKVSSTEIIRGLVVLIIWSLIFIFINSWLFNRGVKKLKVYGG